MALPEVPSGELPRELRNFIRVRAGNRPRGEVVEKWVRDVLAWATTEAEIGRSRTSSDGYNNYLMLYAKGPRRRGAFAYVKPGTANVDFRLLGEHAEGCQHVVLRNVREGTTYQVTVPLKNDEAYEEALKLARVALEGVQ